MEEQRCKNEETHKKLEGFMMEVSQGKSLRASAVGNENSTMKRKKLKSDIERQEESSLGRMRNLDLTVASLKRWKCPYSQGMTLILGYLEQRDISRYTT